MDGRASTARPFINIADVEIVSAEQAAREYDSDADPRAAARARVVQAKLLRRRGRVDESVPLLRAVASAPAEDVDEASRSTAAIELERVSERPPRTPMADHRPRRTGACRVSRPTS